MIKIKYINEETKNSYTEQNLLFIDQMVSIKEVIKSMNNRERNNEFESQNEFIYFLFELISDASK